MRRLKIGSGLLLMAVVASGCGGGGGSGAPSDASEEDFCKAFNSLYDNLGDFMSGDDKAAIEGIKEWGDSMAEVGTPEDIPDEARDGFELMLEAIDEFDSDATMEDFDNLEDDFSDDEQKAIDSFSEYATETCPMEMPDLSDLESSSP